MTSRKPPWKTPNPRKGRPLELTEAQKRTARFRAAKAGRRYPNLIDNMYVARKARAARAR